MTTLLERLITLRNNGPENIYSSGICSSVRLHDSRSDEFFAFRNAVQSWPEFSGDDYYPVKHPCYDDPCEAYHKSMYLWTGEYGAARRRLLDHIINYMEKQQ